MSCERFSDTLADFLERDVPESTRAEMEAHALSCDACGPLLADLRKLRVDAANLEELAPSRDLWTEIAARIETPVVAIGPLTAGDRVPSSTRRRASVWMGLAAAGLVAVTATATYQITKQSFTKQNPVIASTAEPAPAAATFAAAPANAKAPVAEPSAPRAAPVKAVPAGGSAASAAPAATVKLASNATGKLSPAQTYDMEISRLRRVVDRRRNNLDSATVAVLETNLAIIDNAIAQCRRALAIDPSSAYLNESLTDALDNKVQLLRAAATLPAAM